MELKAGYKQTEAGEIPADWDVKHLVEITTEISDGIHTTPEYVFSSGFFFINGNNLVDGKIVITGNTMCISETEYHRLRKNLNDKTILISINGTIGNLAIFNGEKVVLGKSVAYMNISRDICKEYIYYSLMSAATANYIDNKLTGTTISNLSLESLRNVPIPVPRNQEEQSAIASALSDVDTLIATLDRLIAKKRDIKQAAMQELLTGKKRLPGFSGDWEVKKIAEIASLSPEKNTAVEELPVLTCSKHLGFVDSLGYFKNQVFSKDTSTYKLIRRGHIGYPSNHIEEGSIGLQDLYDVALVSPIYVVFTVGEEVNSFFLHRVLKTDSYRQKFKSATTSSVDRRGSLRWPAFSKIIVNIPPYPEQCAIAAVLSDIEAEIDALEARQARAQQIKQGMMQKLLTGRIRLVHGGEA